MGIELFEILKYDIDIIICKKWDIFEFFIKPNNLNLKKWKIDVKEKILC